MLEVKNIDVYYDKVQALRGISISVGTSEIVSVIGANGAGKSTLMKAIMGLSHVSSGEITFMDKAITKLQPHQVVKRGIIYVEEGRRIFPDLSVYDNLIMGSYSKHYSHKEEVEKVAEQYEFFPKLKERASQLGGSLSGGEQQMLAIARGLMADPKLLMLDEPSLGLAPVIVEDIFNIIVQINKKKNLPIILVEQNAYMALETSVRAYVLELGDLKQQGSAVELLESPEIKKAYLGG
ncbi:MAG: ABC transporter ATP-binding protein [Oscillospiraceae bacterium]